MRTPARANSRPSIPLLARVAITTSRPIRCDLLSWRAEGDAKNTAAEGPRVQFIRILRVENQAGYVKGCQTRIHRFPACSAIGAPEHTRGRSSVESVRRLWIDH